MSERTARLAQTESLTRKEIAEGLLATVDIRLIRRAFRQEKGWQVAFPGFRADSLTRAVLKHGSTAVGANIRLLSELCALFLDENNADPAPTLKERAAILQLPASAPEQLHRVVECLRSHDLSSLEITNSNRAGDAESLTPHQVEPPRSETIVRPTNSVSPTAKPDAASPPPTEMPFVWQMPSDDVFEVQQAITLFERCLVAFVQSRLEQLHGDAWLRRGCGHLRRTWQDRAKKNNAPEPKTELGYAEIGELKDIIVKTENWPAFAPYFPDKNSLINSFSDIVNIRVGGMHPGQREIAFLDNLGPIWAMAKILAYFHPESAARINDLCRDMASGAIAHVAPRASRDAIISNLMEFSDPQVVGREDDLRKLAQFWNDPFERVASISGAGGVGKTTLLEQFIADLVNAPLPDSGVPDPEAIIYLTAKTNYIEGIHRRDPEPRRFETLRRVYETVLSAISGEDASSKPIDELRREVLSIAQSCRILFALDNLESLNNEEADLVYGFLGNVPPPSKCIITTRAGRESGRKVVLQGLPFDDSRRLIERRLASYGLDLIPEDEAVVAEIIAYTQGFPLTLVYCVNAKANGYEFSEILDRLKGLEFIRFLEFSFESSIAMLSERSLGILLYLALVSGPRPRKDLATFESSDDSFDDTIRNLISMNLVERVSEDKKNIRFRIATPQIRDYAKKRAPELLSPTLHQTVMMKARVSPIEASSPSVQIEVDRAIAQAQMFSADERGWTDSAHILEGAVRTWGREPRLLAKLGYYYYRLRRRAEARQTLEEAIHGGAESADTYIHLALVHYYDKRFDEGLAKAESALSLRPGDPLAEQIAGQCLLEQAKWVGFSHQELQRRRQLLKKAVGYLELSLISEERSYRDQQHNESSRQLIDRASRDLETMK